MKEQFYLGSIVYDKTYPRSTILYIKKQIDENKVLCVSESDWSESVHDFKNLVKTYVDERNANQLFISEAHFLRNQNILLEDIKKPELLTECDDTRKYMVKDEQGAGYFSPAIREREDEEINPVQEIGDSFINGNISWVREQIGNDLKLFNAVLAYLEEVSPDEAQRFRRLIATEGKWGPQTCPECGDEIDTNHGVCMGCGKSTAELFAQDAPEDYEPKKEASYDDVPIKGKSKPNPEKIIKEAKGLPKKVLIDDPDVIKDHEAGDINVVTDWLSDKYGWCINSLNVVKAKDGSYWAVNIDWDTTDEASYDDVPIKGKGKPNPAKIIKDEAQEYTTRTKMTINKKPGIKNEYVEQNPTASQQGSQEGLFEKEDIRIEYPMRGETYAHSQYGVYKYGIYPEDSVLAGQQRRQFLDAFDTLEQAQAAYPDAEFVKGSGYTPPSLGHLPDEPDLPLEDFRNLSGITRIEEQLKEAMSNLNEDMDYIESLVVNVLLKRVQDGKLKRSDIDRTVEYISKLFGDNPRDVRTRIESILYAEKVLVVPELDLLRPPEGLPPIEEGLNPTETVSFMWQGKPYTADVELDIEPDYDPESPTYNIEDYSILDVKDEAGNVINKDQLMPLPTEMVKAIENEIDKLDVMKYLSDIPEPDYEPEEPRQPDVDDMTEKTVNEVLPGETTGGAESRKCDCGQDLPLQVLKSGAGYYYGYSCPNCGPYGRESEYFRTREEAQKALDSRSGLREEIEEMPQSPKEAFEQKTVAKMVKPFKVVAISQNANSFGLHGIILVGKDGEAYQAGHSYFNIPKQGDIVKLEVDEDGEYNWAKAGFEIPEKKPSAPPEVVKQIWSGKMSETKWAVSELGPFAEAVSSDEIEPPHELTHKPASSYDDIAPLRTEWEDVLRDDAKFNAFVDKLRVIDNRVWDALNIKSGGELKSNPALYKKWQNTLVSALNKAGIKPNGIYAAVYFALEDANYHTLNDFLLTNGYFFNYDVQQLKEDVSKGDVKKIVNQVAQTDKDQLEVLGTAALVGILAFKLGKKFIKSMSPEIPDLKEAIDFAMPTPQREKLGEKIQRCPKCGKPQKENTEGDLKYCQGHSPFDEPIKKEQTTTAEPQVNANIIYQHQGFMIVQTPEGFDIVNPDGEVINSADTEEHAFELLMMALRDAGLFEGMNEQTDAEYHTAGRFVNYYQANKLQDPITSELVKQWADGQGITTNTDVVAQLANEIITQPVEEQDDDRDRDEEDYPEKPSELDWVLEEVKVGDRVFTVTVDVELEWEDTSFTHEFGTEHRGYWRVEKYDITKIEEYFEETNTLKEWDVNTLLADLKAKGQLEAFNKAVDEAVAIKEENLDEEENSMVEDFNKLAGLPSQQVSIFDITNVEEAVQKIVTELRKEYPFVNGQYSTLGGEENVSILLVLSLDPKEEWANGIMENSRYARFHLHRNGVLEAFSGGRGMRKFRKRRVKSIDDAIKALSDLEELKPLAEGDMPQSELDAAEEMRHEKKEFETWKNSHESELATEYEDYVKDMESMGSGVVPFDAWVNAYYEMLKKHQALNESRTCPNCGQSMVVKGQDKGVPQYECQECGYGESAWDENIKKEDREEQEGKPDCPECGNTMKWIGTRDDGRWMCPSCGAVKDDELEEAETQWSVDPETMRKPTRSPWGKPDDVKEFMPGVYWVSTPGHGGMMVSMGVAKDILSPAARKEGRRYFGYYTYEEDEQWAVPMLELLKQGKLPSITDFSSNINKEDLIKIISRYRPDYLKAVGIEPNPEEYSRYQKGAEDDRLRKEKSPDLIVAASAVDGKPEQTKVWTADGKMYIVTGYDMRNPRLSATKIVQDLGQEPQRKQWMVTLTTPRKARYRLITSGETEDDAKASALRFRPGSFIHSVIPYEQNMNEAIGWCKKHGIAFDTLETGIQGCPECAKEDDRMEEGQEEEIFKCRLCGMKKPHSEASDDDISICQDCAEEEEGEKIKENVNTALPQATFQANDQVQINGIPQQDQMFGFNGQSGTVIKVEPDGVTVKMGNGKDAKFMQPSYLRKSITNPTVPTNPTTQVGIQEGTKSFNVQSNIGKAKYVVNFHDGKKTHPDGSDFYDVKIFNNKKDLEKFTKYLTSQGYSGA